MLTPEEELLLIEHLRIASSKIEAYPSPDEDRLRMIRELHPELFSLLERIEPGEGFEILERRRNEPALKDDIDIILSPKGRKWILKAMEMIKDSKR